MTKQQAIEKVENSFPSIWSKDDVLSLLNQINEGTETFDTDKLVEKIKDAVENAINGMSNDDIVDISSCDFVIRNGNEIEIDSIGINTSDIVNDVMVSVVDTIEEFMGELQEQE